MKNFIIVFFIIIQVFSFSVSAIERPKIVNNTIVAGDGTTRLRGGTFWIYGWISDKTTWALSDAPWAAMKENALNALRVACAYRPEHADNYSLDQYEFFLDKIIDMADTAGIYVIIDYHPTPGDYYQSDPTLFDIQKQHARDFWGRFADRYKDRKHVIFELVNEPVFSQPENYNQSLINEFESLWQFVDDLAPETPIITLTFPQTGYSGRTPVQVANSLEGIDWSKTIVGFHSYWRDNSLRMVDLKNNFPCMNTEFGSTIDGGIMKTLDGYKWHSTRMEMLGISWLAWYILDRSQNLQYLDSIVADAKEHGVYWDDTNVRIDAMDAMETGFWVYPGKFGTAAKIQYEITNPGNVNLKIYDVYGKEVAILVNERQSVGAYTVQWYGSNLPKGLYLVNLTILQQNRTPVMVTKKILLTN